MILAVSPKVSAAMSTASITAVSKLDVAAANLLNAVRTASSTAVLDRDSPHLGVRACLIKYERKARAASAVDNPRSSARLPPKRIGFARFSIDRLENRRSVK